ncbi:DUF6477 family protein [Pseudooctadecabacter jejudonensis]|uniref:Uncharacterized protein n=1 Tax=Pseudooctadecabacter jejudonensis TaxID=1391910 RepID=A0A1Y5RFW6_9RHOB|nr:DUF6477 family protein [Pseudooctadecabacter jejudonensis]SLN15669.1 hypothetical protein PSJ8397_00355 [Pseudooctadecabacter jejudonensis]
MQDVLTLISSLKRPTLLVRTARHGIADYNRVVHLRRALKAETLPGPGQAIIKLMEIEAVVDQQRKTKRAEYSVAHHVEILVALMCEARILKSQKSARSAAMAEG